MLKLFGRNHNRILVVRPDRVGDVVLSTPIYHTLKASFPNSFIGALVSPYTSPLLEQNPYIDAVITDEPTKDDFRMKEKEIRKYRFDTALLLLPTKRLAYMIFLAGIPYRVGVGFILYEVITLMHGVSRKKYNPVRHESDYMLDLARKIGARKIWTRPEIFLDEEERASARRFLEQKGFDVSLPIIGIHPGSGRSSPNWQVQRYSELAEMLVHAGEQVLVTGAMHEKDFAEFFGGSFNNGLRVSFGEYSLRELASVISQLGLFVSASTGPMHMAAAVGTPTLSMFCPLTACSPKLWGPLANRSRILLPPEGFCQQICPGDPRACTFGSALQGITVKEVFDASVRMLNEGGPVYSKESQKIR